jgi:hypothetical protein
LPDSRALAVSLCVPSPWSVAYSWAQGIAPRYEVDVTFPQPFPDLWVTGGFGGHCIDAQDHVLLLNRQDVLDGELNSGHLAPLRVANRLESRTAKVFRSADDPNEVIVLQDVADVAKARTWLGSDEMKAGMLKRGVIGSPSIRFAA